MDLCFVNVEQLKNFKIGNNLRIELIGESNDPYTHTSVRHYLVNGQQVNFMQTRYGSNYSIEDEIRLIRKNIKATNNGIVFIENK